MSENRINTSTAQVERSVSESGENTCPVCHDTILMFAIGPCDHPICHRCATRMRVLCEKNDCPICRSATPQVAFVYDRQPFKEINLRDCIPNRKYKIFFEDEEVEDSYLDLLEHRCRMCHNRGPEKTFAQLQTHMRREHQLFACDLCVTFLKIFPYERKFYSRKNLATHRRVGDADDKSYKGHPLCEFCDERYYDKDELMKHLRKDHFFCHFCDQQGSNAYYDQYPDLMDHFAESHYLCTESECGNPSTRFTHAFSSEIDLKAHKASVHHKNFTKAQAREARTLEVDFQLPPRRQGMNRGGGEHYTDSRSVQGSRGGNRFNRRRDYDQDDIDLQRALEASKESFAAGESAEARPPVDERVPDPVHDFPSLNGAAAPTITAKAAAAPHAAKSPEEDFPSLSLARAGGATANQKHQAPAPSKAYSSVMNPPVRLAPAPKKTESKPVPLGPLSTAAKANMLGSRSAPPVKSEDDYPSLGGGASRPLPANQGSWLAKSPSANNTSASAVVASKPLAISKAPSRTTPVVKASPFKKPISDENEFPSLGSNDRSKPRGVGSPFTECSTVQNSASKKTVTPRSERVDDDSFELPNGYYTSLADPTATSNISMVEEVSKPVVKASSKSVPSSNSTKDFPGLPTREKKPLETSNEKKKKKSNNNKQTRDKPKAREKYPAEESNASLSEIASALMQPQSGSASTQNSFSKGTAKLKKPTDWFDNPPKELTEKSFPLPQQKKRSNGLAHENRLSANQPQVSEDSSSSLEDSFPSLHSMSTSVQLQPQQIPLKPPGFSSPPSNAGCVTTPPPGFSTPPRLQDLKSISSTLAPVPASPPGFTLNGPYIPPSDFKTRNTELVEDIRLALETVEDGFDNFRALSRYFRQGMMEASDYHSNVCALMGVEDFVRIFPELLALLPDVGKQKQLWDVHQATARSSKSSASANIPEVSQCPTCGQVTLSRDLQHHYLQHGGNLADNEDFPSLNVLGSEGGDSKADKSNNNTASGLKMNGAWIKAK